MSLFINDILLKHFCMECIYKSEIVSDECLNILNNYIHNLPNEIWQNIWNFIIEQNNVILEEITKYNDLLGLGSVSKEFYNVIFIKLRNEFYEFKCETIVKKFIRTIVEIVYDFNDDPNYLKPFSHYTKKMIEIDNYCPPNIKKISICVIEYFKITMHNLLKMSSDENKDFMYLSNIYDYKS